MHKLTLIEKKCLKNKCLEIKSLTAFSTELHVSRVKIIKFTGFRRTAKVQKKQNNLNINVTHFFSRSFCTSIFITFWFCPLHLWKKKKKKENLKEYNNNCNKSKYKIKFSRLYNQNIQQKKVLTFSLLMIKMTNLIQWFTYTLLSLTKNHFFQYFPAILKQITRKC